VDDLTLSQEKWLIPLVGAIERERAERGEAAQKKAK